MVDAVTDAFADSGADAAVRAAVESVRVVRGIWPYGDPGTLVADAVGLADVRTGLTAIGGNAVYDLVGATAADIAAGDLDVAVICSAETMRTRRRDRAAGRGSAYQLEPDGATPDEYWGSDDDNYTEAEAAVRMNYPVNFYALAEVANRHARGESPEDHRARVAALWASGSAVAATNPDAWYRTARTPEEVATVSPQNRAVAYPYPKLMTSNVNVDQAAAMIMCSAERATEMGLAREQWVFPLAHAGASDAKYSTNRWSFTESPAMRVAGRRALELAGFGVDDCAHLDLYSCFPVAVQLAQTELGIPADRPWTITGGLTFAGGPLNSYCAQALVRAVQLIREDPAGGAGRTLLTGNGGFFSKHSFLVLDGEPGAQQFRSDQPQAEVDDAPQRPNATEVPATATIESYTAMYDRDGALTDVTVACLTAQGERLWATTDAAEMMAELVGADSCGRTVALEAGADDAPLVATLVE